MDCFKKKNILNSEKRKAITKNSMIKKGALQKTAQVHFHANVNEGTKCHMQASENPKPLATKAPRNVVMRSPIRR